MEVEFSYAIQKHGSPQEIKPYFSRNRSLHGFKTEVSIAPNGLEIFASPRFLESKTEPNIYRKLTSNHQLSTTMVPEDTFMSDKDENATL